MSISVSKNAGWHPQMLCFAQNQKSMQFTVIQESRHQKIFAFLKPESENFDLFSSKISQTK